jgi:hypothetical protein
MALFGFVVYGRAFLRSGGKKNHDSSRFSDSRVLVQTSAGQRSGVSWKLRKRSVWQAFRVSTPKHSRKTKPNAAYVFVLSTCKFSCSSFFSKKNVLKHF